MAPVRTKIFAGCILILATLFVSSCASTSPLRSVWLEQQGDQKYYAEYVNGKRVGFSVSCQSIQDCNTVSIEAYDTSFRGKTSRCDRFVEGEKGRLIEFVYEQYKGTRKVKEHRGIRNEAGAYDIYDGDGEWQREIAVQPDAIFVKDFAGSIDVNKVQKGQALDFILFDIGELEHVSRHVEILGKEEIDLFGNRQQCLAVKITDKRNIGTYSARMYFGEDNELKMTRFDLSGFEIVSLRCNYETAMQENDEAHFDGSIKSPVHIRNMGGAQRISYTILSDNDVSPPHTDYQRVRYGADGSACIDVVVEEMPAGGEFPYTGDNAEALQSLECTEILQCNDESVRRTALGIVKDTTDAATAARKIESWVFFYLRKSSGDKLWNSAAEILEERKGLCAEHAILAAALCRSVGIPARIVTGYLYAGGKKFLRHAWTNVYVRDKWYCIDATRMTLWGLLNTYTIGHIATFVYDGDEESTIRMLESFSFKIADVEQYD